MLSTQLFATRRAHASRAEVLHELTAKAVQAEQLGFDTVWLAEHHDTGWNLCTDPLTLLATLAAETTSIRLGAAVVNLSLHHPVRVAEQAAMVNAVSGGRLDLGLGKGFDTSDYTLFDLNAEDADRLFRDKHDRLCSLLSSDPDTAAVPVWLASSGNPNTIELANAHGHGLLLSATGDKLAGIASKCASNAAPVRVGLMRAVHTSSNASAAKNELYPYLTWYMNQMRQLQPHVTPPPIEEVFDTFCVLGSAQECMNHIDALWRAHHLHEVIAVPGLGGMDLTSTTRVLHDLGAARQAVGPDK